jgi:FdrA protein
MKRTFIRKNEYRDSYYLMRLSNEISSWAGVRQATVIMGTPNNKQILEQLGLFSAAVESASSDDLIIAVELESSLDINQFESDFEQIFTRDQGVGQRGQLHHNLESALDENPDANLVVISTPGNQAVELAREALRRGKHVFCFSHHISLEEELELKRIAIDQQLLMMGPDCGTSILDGIGYGFANKVRLGNIGLVSASGSGLQEVSTLIHRGGGGVSQAIGVGGRDMLSPIDGLMSVQAIKMIAQESLTDCLVILGKKSSTRGRQTILKAARKTGLPIIANFYNENDLPIQNGKFIFAETYEECAMRALETVGQEWNIPTEGNQAKEWVDSNLARISPGQWAIRGLFSGGSLCREAAIILAGNGLLIQTDPNSTNKPMVSSHVLVDLGEEQYTEGRPHPFIDSRLRNLEIKKAYSDPDVAVILLDIVLGWGCSPDPAGDVVRAMDEASIHMKNSPGIICSICGTSDDYQGYEDQKNKLVATGVYVAETNAAATRLALALTTALRKIK